MKKVVSILIIFSILFNLSGYYFAFYILERGYKNQFRKHIRNHPENECIEVLTISEKEIANRKIFRWMEEDEFRYKGKMYDVISTHKSGNNYIFYVVNDKNEERLLAKYENIVKQHSGNNLPFHEKSLQLLRHIIKHAVEILHFNLCLPEQFSLIFTEYFFSIKLNDLTVIYTPPEFFY